MERPKPSCRCQPPARGVGSIVAAVGLLAPVVAQACAVCGISSANDPFSRGINWGILFMMAMPFTIAGSLGGWLIFRYWPRGKVRRPADEPVQDAALTQEESEK